MKYKDLKVNVYTSCYSKMLKRHKKENDFYIQVSRNLFMPRKNIDGKSMYELIDENLGNTLGMYTDTLANYERDLDNETIKDIGEIFSLNTVLEELGENPDNEIPKADEEEIKKAGGSIVNYFILCYEDLDSCYTKKDEEKYGGDIKAGEKKTCHRTIIAKKLNELCGLNVVEWKEEFDIKTL